MLSVKRAVEDHAGRGRSIPPHTLLLQLLNSISDGPASAVPGNKFYFCGVEFDDCAWFCHHFQRTTAFLPPDVPQEDVLTLAAYHYLTSIGKRHSRIVRERLMDKCDVVNYSPLMLLATKSGTNIELITHSPSTVFQYVPKGSGGVDSLVRSADEIEERQSGAGRGRSRNDQLDRETASVLRRQADVLGRREVPLCELLFKGLDPRLSLVKRRESASPHVVREDTPSHQRLQAGSNQPQGEVRAEASASRPPHPRRIRDVLLRRQSWRERAVCKAKGAQPSPPHLERSVIVRGGLQGVLYVPRVHSIYLCVTGFPK